MLTELHRGTVPKRFCLCMWRGGRKSSHCGDVAARPRAEGGRASLMVRSCKHLRAGVVQRRRLGKLAARVRVFTGSGLRSQAEHVRWVFWCSAVLAIEYPLEPGAPIVGTVENFAQLDL